MRQYAMRGKYPTCERIIVYAIHTPNLPLRGFNSGTIYRSERPTGDVLRYILNTFFGFMDVMSGGAFSYATVFALSIQPYINASIIMQLLGVAIPALERMQKDEEKREEENCFHHPVCYSGNSVAHRICILHYNSQHGICD